MTIARDIAPWEEMQTRSRENRVSYSEIAWALKQEQDGATANDIAFQLDKNLHRVESTLRQMEINQKVLVKMKRTANGRECQYFLNANIESKPPSTTSNKSNKSKSSKTATLPKQTKASNRKPAYNPPFLDRDGNRFDSLEELANFYGKEKRACYGWIRRGQIGTSGKKPTTGRTLKYYPPFYDQNKKRYDSRKEVRDAFNVSNATITKWLNQKRLGHSGHPATVKPKSNKFPPYLDSQGKEFESRQALADYYGVTIKQVNGWIYRKFIGANGQMPERDYSKLPARYQRYQGQNSDA